MPLPPLAAQHGYLVLEGSHQSRAVRAMAPRGRSGRLDRQQKEGEHAGGSSRGSHHTFALPNMGFSLCPPSPDGFANKRTSQPRPSVDPGPVYSDLFLALGPVYRLVSEDPFTDLISL